MQYDQQEQLFPKPGYWWWSLFKSLVLSIQSRFFLVFRGRKREGKRRLKTALQEECVGGESRLAEKNEFIKNGRAAGRHNSNYCIVLTKLNMLR